MPVITSGLYQIILEATYLGVQVRNSFFFEHTSSFDDLQDVCAVAFDDDLLPLIAATQSDEVTYQNIRCINVTGILADANFDPTTLAGSEVGAPMPSFNAYAIRLNRTTKETRNGQKRFAGVTEENTSENKVAGAFLVTLGLLADALNNAIPTPTNIFTPVIARQSDVVPANWTVNPVSTGTVSPNISTQNTRKVGRGI